jgi:hypothetical protein
MLRLAAAIALVSLPALGSATAATRPTRTVLVVPQGKRYAPRHVGTRDCIAYPRGCVNGVGGIEVAYAVTGKAPRRAQAGVVLTDTNCQADAYGVSHCLNRIRLPHGRVITVRHDHSMMNDPCLAPGERVVVRSA